jgi:hypothetical protein
VLAFNTQLAFTICFIEDITRRYRSDPSINLLVTATVKSKCPWNH